MLDAAHAAKVAHVTGHGGSSVEDVFGVVIGTAVWSIMAHAAFASAPIYGRIRAQSKWLSLLMESFAAVAPLVASQMVPGWFGPSSCCVAAVVATIAAAVVPKTAASASHHLTSVRPRNAVISLYRGTIMLMTACAILAVDFHAFPRWLLLLVNYYAFAPKKLAGVGGAVFSSGLVAGAPWKLAQAPKPADVWAAPILVVLGLGRVVTVKATNYVEHASEYGVHWNFFFTLAAVTLAHTCLRAGARSARVSLTSTSLFLVASALAAVQHYLLTAGGLEDMVMAEGPRVGFVAANREGLVSMLGYWSIFEVGCTAGSVCLAVDSMKKHDDGGAGGGARTINRQVGRRRGGIARGALGIDEQVAAWLRWGMAALLFILACFQKGGEPSRRLVNASYIGLVSTLNMCVLLAIWLAMRVGSGWKKQPVAEAGTLFGLISKHQMPTFLAANLLTGAVNLSTNTLAYSQLASVGIVSAYLLAVCCIAGFVDQLKR